MDGYKHYIRVDSNGLVIHGFTDAFETAQTGDLLLSGDDGRHFQIVLTNERGQFKFKVVNGQMVARTQTELDLEYNSRPPAPKTDLELLREENDSLKHENAKISTDLQGFMDYFFVKFPE